MKSRVDIDQARAMRESGMTLDAIGQEFGVTRERIRQLIGSVTVTKACLTCGEEFSTGYAGREFCSNRCRTPRKPCPDCGRLIGSKSVRCVDCRLAAHERAREALWNRIEELWADGLPVKEIAVAVGRANANSLGVEMARMKHAGRELAPRRSGWRGHGNPTGPQRNEAPARTTQEARARFALATRNGTLIRPSECERCGRSGYVDGHHHDLLRAPFEVEWLCRDCHLAHHAAERQAA